LHNLFIVFALFFFIFLSMLFILMFYIIIFARLQHKIVAINIFLIQKLFDFKIFLLHLLLILKTIILLKRLIFCIFFRTFSVLIIFESHVNVIIFIALILCILFVSFSLLIYIINFISSIDRRFESTCSTFILIFVYATNNELYIMLVYILVSCVSFSTLFTFSSWFVVIFNLFDTKIMSIRLFFAKNSLNLRVNFLTKVYYLINVVIEIISNAFFFRSIELFDLYYFRDNLYCDLW